MREEDFRQIPTECAPTGRDRFVTVAAITVVILLLRNISGEMLSFPAPGGKSTKFDRESIGAILNARSQPIGSAFIAGPDGVVVTCAHVAVKDDALSYDSAAPGTPVPLRLQMLFPRFDLAILELKYSVTTETLQYGDFKRIRPGDGVSYLGWEAGTRAIRVNYATVSAVGAVLNEGAIVDFLEFEGVGLPGYSGGPVFDSDGRVVAVMREAWTKKGVKGGEEIIVNRAFSIEILSVLQREVKTPRSDFPR